MVAAVKHLYYILDDAGNAVPVPVAALAVWAKRPHSSRVAREEIGDVLVSTIFLGIDHNFSEHGSPVLWETMVFGGAHDQAQERYTSKTDALAGHARWVAKVSAKARLRLLALALVAAVGLWWVL